jgi:hypothetical protein
MEVKIITTEYKVLNREQRIDKKGWDCPKYNLYLFYLKVILNGYLRR